MDERFIVIYDWMVTDLGLTCSHAVIYAIIYSYSKDGEWFQGSLSYLSKRTGMSRKSVTRILQSLCDNGLIRRRERPHKMIKYVDYQTTGVVKMSLGTKCPKGGDKMSLDVGTKCPTIINNNKNKIKNARARKWGDYSQRTDVDYDAIEEVLKNQVSTRVATDPDDIVTR